MLNLRMIRSQKSYDALIYDNKVVFLQNLKSLICMSELNTPSSPPKKLRRYSEMTIDSKLTFSTRDQFEHHGGSKRKISFDYNKHFNRSDKSREQLVSSNQQQNNYKLSTEVLSFQMQQQRSIQLKIIKQNPQLLSYYSCLKKLFMILYQSSIVISENMFQISQQIMNNNHIQMLCVLFDILPHQIDVQAMSKMKIFAKNFSFLSSSISEFEQRIELVAVKTCLHNQKRPKIQKAFLNTKIQAHWRKIEEKFKDLQIYSYIEDQFEKAQEKLCFMEIKQFIKSKLSSQSFGKILRKNCTLQEIDHDMNFDFKFEFFLMEQLCFNTLDDLFKDEGKDQSDICQIM